MPQMPEGFKDFSAKSDAIHRRQLSRGFTYFLITRSAIGSIVYGLFWAAVLFFRGAAYVRSQRPVYWTLVPVLLVCAAVFSSVMQYWQHKRSVQRYAALQDREV
jgi:hypothetical protein